MAAFSARSLQRYGVIHTVSASQLFPIFRSPRGRVGWDVPSTFGSPNSKFGNIPYRGLPVSSMQTLIFAFGATTLMVAAPNQKRDVPRKSIKNDPNAASNPAFQGFFAWAMRRNYAKSDASIIGPDFVALSYHVNTAAARIEEMQTIQLKKDLQTAKLLAKKGFPFVDNMATECQKINYGPDWNRYINSWIEAKKYFEYVKMSANAWLKYLDAPDRDLADKAKHYGQMAQMSLNTYQSLRDSLKAKYPESLIKPEYLPSGEKM